MSGAKCMICDKMIEDYEPQMCCNGFECGCMGMPTEPPICSNECWDRFDQRKKEPQINELEDIPFPFDEP